MTNIQVPLSDSIEVRPEQRELRRRKHPAEGFTTPHRFTRRQRAEGVGPGPASAVGTRVDANKEKRLR